jgi:hypothetical protein
MPARKRRTACAAGFLRDTVLSICSVGALSGVALSSLYLLRDVDRFKQLPSETNVAMVKQQPDEEEDDNSFIYAVSTVISLIPVLNFTVRLSVIPT